jgi:hypothetical protein
MTSRAQAGYSHLASRSGSFYVNGRRMQVAKRGGKEPARIFEFGDMRFEIHITEKGDMDLQHIKVTFPIIRHEMPKLFTSSLY